ncbi:hypothetical protein PspLS_03797 [Pyricularia sp. CBS 133598]|nr:hypothetical protein PspLS_03797 [Pyricularia sp. CBS 133598]
MSVFTYDPDPPRVSSPWLQSADPGKSRESSPVPAGPTASGLLSDYGVTKLEAEPQEGPTEYKLHLLLRQRRKFRYMSTTNRVAGSQLPRPTPAEPKALRHRATSVSISTQTRQARLLQLTTQLFWRLRQSSPYHASTSQEVVIPQLADDFTSSTVSIKPGKPLPGLEESRGSLYEIGVADDGTLVGLTKDELDESFANLRIMAASLGCVVEILRRVVVGECEWVDDSPSKVAHREDLWVAEALVTPNKGSTERIEGNGHSNGCTHQDGVKSDPTPSDGPSATEQLRVTLTGPTTSGKSTLLGTLSTGTLDNGHGKSRLSLLRHRHELASGVTSSVAQELIGYRDNEVINYDNGNIESWIGIHDFTGDGRLVFVSDSAGHPRYRRTILRGIVGWAPHWTLLCLAADDDEGVTAIPCLNTPTQDGTDCPGSGIDLARAHLELCLKLELPLAIVITKVDKGTKPGLQKILSKVLTGIKQANRTPRLLHPGRANNLDTAQISDEDLDSVKKALGPMYASGDLLSTVPIVLTSAVNGTGIGLVHALLKTLPLPAAPTSQDLTGPALNPEQPVSLFHVEVEFSLPASHASLGGSANDQADLGTVVAGYLRFGTISVGDQVVLGPFPSDEDDSKGCAPPESRHSPASYGMSLTHPSATELNRFATRTPVSASTIKGEWHTARVVSLRNLRLPVLKLEGGQAGTVGLVIDTPKESRIDDSLFETVPAAPPKIRKGMVLAIPSKHMLDGDISLQAASGLTAVFPGPEAATLSAGNLVNIYVASVRATARVLRVYGTSGSVGLYGSASAREEDDDVFGFHNGHDDMETQGDQSSVHKNVEIRLELLNNREWIELGSRIVILEGSRPESSGLEGFVGTVVEVVD